MTLYAVTNAKTGRICWRVYRTVPAIYGTRKAAEADCAYGQVVRRVAVRVVKA